MATASLCVCVHEGKLVFLWPGREAVGAVLWGGERGCLGGLWWRMLQCEDVLLYKARCIEESGIF